MNYEPLSEGAGIPIVDSATNIHIVGAAKPGRIRGAICYCDLVNGTGGALTVTIDVAGISDDFSVAALAVQHLEVWVPAGTTLKMTGSAVGVTCYGYVKVVA